jgi:hypothetical protein
VGQRLDPVHIHRQVLTTARIENFMLRVVVASHNLCSCLPKYHQVDKHGTRLLRLVAKLVLRLSELKNNNATMTSR